MSPVLEQLKEILKVDAMVHTLKYPHDVRGADACIRKALDIIRKERIDIKGITPILERVYSDYCSYYKKVSNSKTYTKEFEERKEKAKELIQIYINEAEK
jgi:hypothetical protein